MQKSSSSNPRTCENSKYFKSIYDAAVIECGEIITVMNIASSKITNAIAINVASAASINFHTKKVKDCYILHTVLLAIVLVPIIIIICYRYTKQNYINAITI